MSEEKSEPSLQTFPCNNCSDPPAQCEYCALPRSWKEKFEDKLREKLESEIKYSNFIKYSNRTLFVFDKIGITYFGKLTKANREIINSFFKLAKIEFHPLFKEKILGEK